MRASQGRIGRVFVIRLDDGDVVPDCIEKFAAEQRIAAGHVVLIGGIGGGEVVVGPRRSDEMPPEAMLVPVDGAHEVAGVGIIAPGDDGQPTLHIHAAMGRAGKTTTGCLRPGVTTWVVGEVIIYEILDVVISRPTDAATGFTLLKVAPQ